MVTRHVLGMQPVPVTRHPADVQIQVVGITSSDPTRIRSLFS